MSELTPQQRGGQTRRERTRRLVEDALDELLQETPYDQVRAGDIVERANIGAATFYQVVGDKSTAMGSLVVRALTDKLPDLHDVGAPVDPVAGIALTLKTLGEYGSLAPEHAHGYCRAYDCSVAHLPASAVQQHAAGELQRRVKRLLTLAAQSNACPALLATDDFAAAITSQALLAATPHPEHWRSRIQELFEILQINASVEA